MGSRYKGKKWCSKFPDKVFGVNLSEACYEHDVRYGDKSKSRWTADLELFNDVKRKGAPITASFMWLGVRLFGWYWYMKGNR